MKVEMTGRQGIRSTQYVVLRSTGLAPTLGCVLGSVCTLLRRDGRGVETGGKIKVQFVCPYSCSNTP